MVNEKYLGVEVTPLTMDKVIEKVEDTIIEDKKAFIVAINPEKVIKAQNDKNLEKLINSADIKIPDGSGIVIASKLKKGEIKERVTGIDLMKEICKLSGRKSYRIFLLGAKPGVAKRASEVLINSIDNIQIVGVHDGYFEMDKEIVKLINDSKANIVFVALGSPKQENFIKNNMDKINSNIFMGVGGSFDVICGDINRAPVFMQKIGAEWLYRLIKEPSRISRVKVLPEFILKVLFEKK